MNAKRSKRNLTSQIIRKILPNSIFYLFDHIISKHESITKGISEESNFAKLIGIKEKQINSLKLIHQLFMKSK